MGGRIECVFFSEFHPTLGPKITYQVRRGGGEGREEGGERHRGGGNISEAERFYGEAAPGGTRGEGTPLP